ncbi:MAG TPA: endonuclease [Dehalococcoidia bacterium]|nr:endonuclease [Dehalococcoidia bacterium]
MSHPSPAARPAAPPPAPALVRLHAALASAYAGQLWHWAPGVARGPMEIIAGAVLVQHTTWTNAERALDALRTAGALDASALAALPEREIAALVRVSGTPTVKARRLRAVARTIEAAGGLDALLALPHHALRAALIETHGIGPETADAVALYAAGHPAFVIDAYTRRLFGRLALGPGARASYAAWQRWFEDRLPPDVTLYRNLHAYIVLHGKTLCRAVPRCDACPLRPQCPEGCGR